MPLLNIAFWFLAGLIAGWFLATSQDESHSDTTKSTFGNQPAQNSEITRPIASIDNNIENGFGDDQRAYNEIAIKQFEQSLQEDSGAAVVIYQQEVHTGGDLAKQMRDRLIVRIVRLMQLRRYSDAQQLIETYLDANAYDMKVLLLQAQLYHAVKRYIDALISAYDAKIYGDQSVEEETVDQLIAKIFDEYEQQLLEKSDWNSLASLYSLMVEKDYSEYQSSYYYKLAQAQFKLGDYHSALASLSHIIGYPLWSRKASYFQQTIEKFIEGDGIIAIPVKLIDPHKFLVIATINDTIEAELLIDTGASLSVLKDSFVVKVELLIKEEEPLTLTTVSDTVEARTVKLDSFGIDEIKFADMPIAITEMPDDFTPDGLLGMDFLSKFEFNLDQEALLLYLYSL